MTKHEILQALDKISSYAKASKLYRLFHNPFRYIFALGHKNIVYRLTQKGKLINAKTFWGDEMKVLLPASTDIYLSGSKTHDSEIRLCKFLAKSIHEGEDVLDIGAHVGFITLLSALLSKNGTVISVEASKQTFHILSENVKRKNHIKALNIALSDKNGSLEFLEFPVIYSEFNTLEAAQYQNEPWFKSIIPVKSIVESKTGDTLIKELNIKPQVIKIDVEGAEEKVVSGLQKYLSESTPLVIMEFAHTNRKNTSHVNADKILKGLGYKAYCITNSGELQMIDTPTENYVDNTEVESDNIVYRKVI